MLTQQENPDFQTRKSPHPTPKRTPAHLYLRGSIYYFRYALSEKDQARTGHREVRVSLRTGFLKEAKKRANRLRYVLEDTLAGFSLPNWNELKARLAAELEEKITSCPDKKELEIQEIRNRMDAFLVKMLNQADKELHYPADSPVFNDGHLLFKQDGCLMKFYNEANRDITNNREKLKETYYPMAIYHLLNEGVISINELTHESILPILNEYHKKIQVAYNKIMLARHNGDYSYERTFYSSGTIPENKPVFIEKHETRPKLLLSQLIEKYISSKLSDKKWTEHNLDTHKSRLNPIIEILGDIPAVDVSREKMREYRDILRQLPPHRKKSPRYRNKTISEIIAVRLKS